MSPILYEPRKGDWWVVVVAIAIIVIFIGGLIGG
jgi:hypothetical protein